MALIVQKFGGTSVADSERIQEAVNIIQSELSQNNQIIVVVSAMAGATNQLVTLCNEVASLNSDSKMTEYDVALASGEIVTSALLALSLRERGLKARSVLAWQLPIITDSSHGKALVQSIKINLLTECLSQATIPVIAGFQGVTRDNRISTLGRGGSDTTAALVAAAIKADRCDIYTDVEGVFTADPRIVHQAKKLDFLSFEEMLEFAASGAKVLHPRSVEVALRYKIPIRVLSSFKKAAGTLITAKDNIMENRIITGITSNKNLLRISIENPLVSFSKICIQAVQNNIYIDHLINSEHNKLYSFIAPISEKNKIEKILLELKTTKQITDFSIDTKLATVSIVGYGIKNDNALVYKVLAQLEKENVPVLMLQVSEVKISILINDQNTEKTVLSLHKLFKLDQ